MKTRYLPLFALLGVAIGVAVGSEVIADHLYPYTPVGSLVVAAGSGFAAGVLAFAAVSLFWCPSTSDFKGAILCFLLIGFTVAVLGPVVWKNLIHPHRTVEENIVYRLRALPVESLEARDLITALGNEGPKARWAEPILREIMRNPNHHSRDHAAWALERIMGRDLTRWERFYLLNVEMVARISTASSRICRLAKFSLLPRVASQKTIAKGGVIAYSIIALDRHFQRSSAGYESTYAFKRS